MHDNNFYDFFCSPAYDEMPKDSIRPEKLILNAIENPTKQNELEYLEFFSSIFKKI
jgi:hypothetical protein